METVSVTRHTDRTTSTCMSELSPLIIRTYQCLQLIAKGGKRHSAKDKEALLAQFKWTKDLGK